MSKEHRGSSLGCWQPSRTAPSRGWLHRVACSILNAISHRPCLIGCFFGYREGHTATLFSMPKGIGHRARSSFLLDAGRPTLQIVTEHGDDASATGSAPGDVPGVAPLAGRSLGSGAASTVCY
jgi:hypothetical protein